MFFLAMTKAGVFQEEVIEYKAKLLKVAAKIDKWHQRMSLKKQGSFHEDADFIEIGGSPSRFDTSFEEEKNISPSPFDLEATSKSVGPAPRLPI